MARFTAARIIFTGYSIKLVSALLLALVFVPDASVWTLVGPLALWGLGGGIASAPIMAVGMSSVPPERHGMASGVINSLFSLGAATGTALLGVVYKARIGAAAGSDPALDDDLRGDVAGAAATGDVDRLTDLTDGTGEVAGVVERAVASGATGVMLFAAGVAVLTLIITVTMVRQKDISDEEETEEGEETAQGKGPGDGGGKSDNDT